MVPAERLLSIIIPVYNAAATVGRTIASLGHIAVESRPSVEVIVIDDGSTDGSDAIVRQSAEELPEFGWQIITKANGGPAVARNAGLRAASGIWVFFLDADDELTSDLVPALRASAAHTCVGFSLAYHRHGRPWRRFRPPRLAIRNHLGRLTSASPYPISSLAFRRDRIDLPFDESLPSLEDWWFWMSNPRIFDAPALRPDVVAGVIHIHDQNLSGQFARQGRGRALVSVLAAAKYAAQLTAPQRNNLYIQGQIGALQQGRRPHLRTYVALPCSPTLYAKLLVYTLSAIVGVAATPYRSRGPAPSGGRSDE